LRPSRPICARGAGGGEGDDLHVVPLRIGVPLGPAPRGPIPHKPLASYGTQTMKFCVRKYFKLFLGALEDQEGKILIVGKI